MAKKFQKILSIIKLVLSIPSVCIAIGIFLLAVISIIASKFLSENNFEFMSSVCSNVFAGLITGLAITVLTSSKSLHTYSLQGKIDWFQHARELLHQFEQKRDMLLEWHDLSDEDFFGKVYDVATCANHVNEHILVSTFAIVKWFDPPKYFYKHYGYDPKEQSKQINELLVFLKNYDIHSDQRKNLLMRLEKTSSLMFFLDSHIHSDLITLRIKLANAKKSIV